MDSVRHIRKKTGHKEVFACQITLGCGVETGMVVDIVLFGHEE